MPRRDVITGSFTEGQDLPLVAFVPRPGTTVALAPGDIKTAAGADTGFDIRAFDLDSSTPETAIFSELAQDHTATVWNPVSEAVPVVSTPLRLDDYWNRNTEGYNVRLLLRRELNPGSSASFLAVGGHSYKIEATFHTSEYGKVPLIFLARCRPSIAAV